MLTTSRVSVPQLQLSDRVNGIDEALSIYVNQLVYDLKRRGKDIIALSLGEAFFDIPLFDFSVLDKEKAYHYSESRGIPELREKVAQYYFKFYGAQVDPATQVLITAGSKPAIFMTLQAILNPGDEALIHEPGWLSYQEHVRLLDGHPRFIPYDCPVGEFDHYFTERTRILIINNPNNPCGRIYTADELRLMIDLCRSRGIYVLVDEAYSDFVLDTSFVSMATIASTLDGVVVVNSLSKNLGMSGWRIGYVMSDSRLINAVLKLNQHIITCGPSILLHYVATYFDQIIDITLPQVRDVVQKRVRIGEAIDRYGLRKMGGGATFYFFISIGDSPNSAFDIAMHLLLNEGIAVVPGNAYGESTARFIRVSIGTESEERINDALRRIAAVLQEPLFDYAALTALLAERRLPTFHARRDPPSAGV